MLLEARDIVKRFPGTTALAGVSLGVAAGEVLSVIGENGAGKSTLMKILAGDLRPDAGEVMVAGAKVRFRDPRDAMAAGVVLIHQELSLADNLDVGSNILLGREPRRGPFLDRPRARREATRALEAVGLTDLEPERSIAGLGMGTRQLVEIAKAMSTDARVIVMDEPTSSLTETETEVLLDTVGRLKAKGRAVIYISHRLEEVRRISDRVEVLRDGRQVGSLSGGGIDRAEMVRLMVGRDLEPSRARKVDRMRSGEPRLSVHGAGTSRFPKASVDLQVEAGEIVALAGLVGAGRTELLRAIVGVDRMVAGRVDLDGGPLGTWNPAAAAARGLALVPEDRKHDGLMLQETIEDNLTLASMKAICARLGLRSRSRERTVARAMVQDLGIRPPRPRAIAGGLSGGNQQKVALGRWLACNPGVLLLDEPTRGVDVGAKAEIHAILQRLADQGAAILFASSEMEELLSLADRILVMQDGRISGELRGDEATEAGIMDLATAATAAGSGGVEHEGHAA